MTSPRPRGEAASARVLAREVFTDALVAVVYVLVTKLGLRFASVTSSVTLVWPGTGMALCALLLLGRRRWVGVALGAFATNVSTPGVGPVVAAVIAAGNTLEAVVGQALLRRARFDGSLGRIADVLRLVLLAGVVSTLVSATLGILALRAGGLVGDEAIGQAWLVWWVGDLMGDLVFAPLLLTLALRPRHALPRRWAIETATLSIALIAATTSTFGLLGRLATLDFPQTYVVFPLLVWAALRFGPSGAATANFAVSMISVVATASGKGPFVRSTLNESLFQLQTFMALTLVTTLLLGAAVAERARAVALRDDFLVLASHELNTPLAALQLDLASLRRMLARNDVPDSKIRHRAEHAEEQLDRLRELVARLLDSSQIAAGRLALSSARVDLTALARDVARRFAARLEDQGRTIELDEPGPVEGDWDRLRLELVLVNLVSNAEKYGLDQPIRVRVSATANEATLEVTDHGIGIPRSQQERIFERFERGVKSDRYPGFGLGLWITKAVVEAMRGSITVSSEEGRGTTFRLTLPR